jgi:hypothetical protein
MPPTRAFRPHRRSNDEFTCCAKALPLRFFAKQRNSLRSSIVAALGTNYVGDCAMKRTLLTLAFLAGVVAAAQPVIAQVGTSNGSGSGFLNADIMVGRGGTPGPADLNLRLGGAGYLSPYRVGTPIGISSLEGRVLTQPAVIPGACGATVITQPAVVDACPSACPAPVVMAEPACTTIAQPMVISQPAVACPAVCLPSDALFVEGTSAPTLIDI